MIICRISKIVIISPLNRRRFTQANKPLYEIVVFSEALTLDSHGCCAQIHDRKASQTKYLIVGEPSCRKNGQCSKPPTQLSDTIHITGQGTLVEIISRDLIVTEKAKKFCQLHGVLLTALPALAT